MFRSSATTLHPLVAFCIFIGTCLISVQGKTQELAQLLVPDIVRDWTEDRVEVFSGADATENSWLGYGGFGLALNGTLDGEGFRLRFFGGRGQYTYKPDDTLRRTDLTLAEIFVGHQWRTGRLITKLYAGATYEDHDIAPADRDNAVAGQQFGVKLLTENWIDLSKQSWLSADASYSTATEGYAGFLRLGYRPVEWMTFGPEAAAFGNSEYDALRAGAFVRFHYLKTDLTVSGGVSGDYETASGAYGTMSFYHKF